MAAYRGVYDSRHLPADCQEPGSAPEPYANRVWATFRTTDVVARSKIQKRLKSRNNRSYPGPVSSAVLLITSREGIFTSNDYPVSIVTSVTLHIVSYFGCLCVHV